jgi:hypothetical protein
MLPEKLWPEKASSHRNSLFFVNRVFCKRIKPINAKSSGPNSNCKAYEKLVVDYFSKVKFLQKGLTQDILTRSFASLCLKINPKLKKPCFFQHLLSEIVNFSSLFKRINGTESCFLLMAIEFFCR